MANINKIRVSGTTYDIQDSNASKTVELTQAQYDALTTKDPNTYYIITDATPIDITDYYTKSEADDLLDDKLDVTAYTPTDLSNYYTKSETSGATQIQTALNGKQDVSGMTAYTETSAFTAHTANTTVHVTAQDKTNWNNKSDFSGSYNDLTNKPTIPTVPTNVSDFTNDAGYITSDDISGKTNQSDFVSHSGNTTMHVTANEKSTWNAKSDFSGSYNDLADKPTIPTSASQLTNDSGYITSSALNGYATEDYVTAATNDMATKTWVGQQGYLTQHQDISGKQDVSGMTAYTTTATTNTLSGTVTAHTADTTIHVTTAQTAAWDAKSNFSGSYNDLTDKPTIPTSASQLTNDTGYITSSALDGYATTATTSALNNTLTAHTADTTIHVTSSDKSSWNGAATNASNAITALGGLSLVKLSQSEYDALATKDNSTLYVIVN